MYLVIGATSFIGVYVVEELLKHSCQVAVTDRSDKLRKYYESLGVQYYNLDLTKKEDFAHLPQKKFDGVVLLAGLLPANIHAKDGEEYADQYFLINTIGTINVLEYCRKNKINRVISATSYADVINSWSKDKAITEEEPRNYKYSGDHATYVFSKNAANDMLEYYNQQYGMKNAVFRFPMVYGVGPHGYFSVDGKKTKSGFQVFLDNAAEGKDICIFGDGTTTRDVVYVKDVANAFYEALVSDNTYGLYNITSGTGLTLLEQAKIMADVFKKDKKSEVVLMPEKTNTSKSFLFNIDKARRDFGYAPKFADYRLMMQDYKKDLESGKYKEFFRNV